MPNTEDYPIRWNTVHFGINANDIAVDPFTTFRDVITSRGYLSFIDGDGWQNWGGVRDTGGNDLDTMHIQIAVPTKADTAAVIEMLRSSALPFVPRTSLDEHGNIVRTTVIVTQSEDFTQEVYRETF